jgi:DNA-binding Xre family transcriptional regulator
MGLVVGTSMAVRIIENSEVLKKVKQENRMEVSYDKLWKMLIDKKMKKTELLERASIGTSTLAKLGKDKPVSMAAIMKICEALDCGVEDVMEIRKSNKAKVVKI